LSKSIAPVSLTKQDLNTFAYELMIHSNIHSLKITGNEGFDEEGFTYLCSCLKEHKTLKTIRFPGDGLNAELIELLCEALVTNISITCVDLSFNTIDETGARSIAKLITENSKIQTLILSNCNIENDGAKWINDALKVNARISKLNLDGNKISTSALQYIDSLVKMGRERVVCLHDGTDAQLFSEYKYLTIMINLKEGKNIPAMVCIYSTVMHKI
jgi:Ran GTPase-activating protein (RanGAP) involved in mRNA processing and transport